MAKNETRRMRRSTMVNNGKAYAALQQLNEYKPANNAYDFKHGEELNSKMNKMQIIEAQVEATYKAAKDNATAAEWAFHNYMLGVKDQVKAQYGASSNEVQSVGLKKKAEYKSPKSKKKAK